MYCYCSLLTVEFTVYYRSTTHRCSRSAPSSSSGRPTTATATGAPPQDSTAPATGAGGENEDAEAEARRLRREAEKARHGAFLFGCASELSQGTRAVLCST
jgi:hypothetical protein